MEDNQQPTGENVFNVWWNSKGIYYELLEPEHLACLNEILKKKSLCKLICDFDAIILQISPLKNNQSYGGARQHSLSGK